MASYLKNATEYGLYVLESNSTYNDDFITDHAGDPGEADLALYTEGLEMIHIADVTMIDSKGSCNFESEETYLGWRVKGIGAGKKDYYSYQDDRQELLFAGEVDLTHLDYLQRAFKEFNISRSTIVPKCLVWMRGADIYKNWFDEAGDSQDYCPVVWRLFHWRHNVESKVWEVTLGFEVVWT